MKFLNATFTSTRSAAAVCGMVLVLVATPGAQTQRAASKAVIPITDCVTINKPGSYVLAADLNCPSVTSDQTEGIIITADRVTLHLAGHTISAAGPAIDAENVTSVDIIGPGTVSSIGEAVTLNVIRGQVVGVTCDGAITCIGNEGSNSRIVANKLMNYEVGVTGAGQNNLYAGNTCSGGDVALDISGEGDLIKGNICGGSAFWGLELGGTDETVVGNQFDNNGFVGILVSGTGNRIVNNEATNNTFFDLQDENACGENVWKLNAFTSASASCIN